MKTKIAISLLALLMMTGCTPNGTDGSESDSEHSSSEHDDDHEDGGSTASGPVSHHNQGRACLDCHGPGGEERFRSGATVYTAIDGSASNEYAFGYKIRLVLDNTQSINYSAGRGTGNSRTSDSRLTSSYTFTAQVVDSSGSVVNTSAVNSHDYTRVDCNGCHTSSGNSGAPGRIVSYSYTGGNSGGTAGETTGGITVGTTTATNTFAETVMPLLVTYCQGCHGNNGNFSVTTPALTYDNIMVNNFADVVNVDLSPLLTKASGNSHGGGTILPVDGSVYLSLRNWIAQGADGSTTGSATTGGAVSFSASVMPVVTSNCKSCHGSSGNFSVTTTAATYNNIIGNGFVDTAAADASLLLTKASGTNHGGGTVLPSSGSGYRLLRDWISQGALNN